MSTDELFHSYTQLSKDITKYIKSNDYNVALIKLNESLELSFNLSNHDKWYTESAYRKIRLLIKTNMVEELNIFKDQYSQVVKSFNSHPLQKFSISDYYYHMALIDEYFAFRLIIKSIEKKIYANSLANDEMVRQNRKVELKEDWIIFYEEILDIVKKYNIRITNKSNLKKYIHMSNEEIKPLNMFDILLGMISFPVLLR